MVARLKVVPQAFYLSKVLLFWGVKEGTWKLSNRVVRDRRLFSCCLLIEKEI